MLFGFKLTNRVFLGGVLFGALFFMGCSVAMGSRFQALSVQDAGAVLYVYRVPTITSSFMASSPKLFLNGSPVTNLKNGGYVALPVMPGGHELELRFYTFGIEQESARKLTHIHASENEALYFEYRETTTGYEKYGSTEVRHINRHFMRMPKGLGEIRIMKTRQLNSKAI